MAKGVSKAWRNVALSRMAYQQSPTMAILAQWPPYVNAMPLARITRNALNVTRRYSSRIFWQRAVAAMAYRGSLRNMSSITYVSMYHVM